MTGTLKQRVTAPSSTEAALLVGDAAAPVAAVRARSALAIRPWSALICGMAEDRTLLVVDWLLLACREAGLVAQAVPLAAGDAAPHGMYVEVAADPDVEASLGDVPWGAVDLVVAGEHLELVRAIEAGFAHPEVTTVIASCRRSFTAVERDVAPQHVLSEREIDELATEHSLAYHAFDGQEVGHWYHLPSHAQPGLLLGAICGSGVTGLDEACFRDAIDRLGIDDALYAAAFHRGTRLGRRSGGRIRRSRTSYQFTRRRRSQVDHRSRRSFEQLVARADEIVSPEHVPALQDAIFRLCEFQDSDWAARLVDHVADLARAERDLLGCGEVTPADSIVPDVICALATLLVWPDAAWIANRKRRSGRLKDLRAAHGITRGDAFELVDYVPLDALDRSDARSPRLRRADPAVCQPSLLQPLRVERIRTTSLGGALRLRRLAASARYRAGSARQRHELDTAEAWLEAMHDTLRTDHALARIVARSGSIVQGSGAVRAANRATAHAFWGRIVRQSLAIDRASGSLESAVARRVVPFAWEQLCRSGPLAMWEYAAQVLGIALAHARGVTYEETVALADTLCEPRRLSSSHEVDGPFQ